MPLLRGKFRLTVYLPRKGGTVFLRLPLIKGILSKYIQLALYTRQTVADLIELGELVKNARKEQKLSQNELVQRSKVSRARIEALENGRISEIGFKNLMRVMNALGLDLRATQLNNNRPTLEDLREEGENASSLGRR
jgi:predicted XRE-type DNA-binding protein